ncbi:MAG: T9SS C-terminal target domain-containing protein [Chitinophagaceae bacterium]|nr:MAG: T9SS C-terminal target domain-containing protein [Chitinophagaceae bacterium]
MKKLLLTPLLLLFPLIMFAQVCTPDPQYTMPGIYPDSSVNIPPACVGVLYEQTVTIIVDDEIQGATINTVTLTNVIGLPAGFTYQCEPANCVFTPNTPYCIFLSGTPTLADTGSYDISFEVEASGNFMGIPITETLLIEDFYELVIGDNPSVNAGPDVSISSGDSIQIGNQPLATGGTAPYTYIWSPSASLSNPAAENPYASPTNSTTYNVTVTDQNGCVSTDDVTVEVLGTLLVDAGPDVDACEMDSTFVGTELIISGGVEPYTYSWFNAGGTLISVNEPMVFNAHSSYEGTYTVIVEDANGLIGQDEIEFNVFARPNVSLVYDNQVCRVDENFPISGGTPQGGIYFVNDIPTALFNPTVHPGNSIEVKYIYDDGVCVDSALLTININDLPAVNAGNDTLVYKYIDALAEIELNASGDGDFVWSPGEFLSDSTIANPVAMIEETTVFSVTLTDANGCSNSDEIEVSVETIINSTSQIANQNIDIYPNPVTDFINIRAKSNMSFPMEIMLYDLNGRVISSELWKEGENYRLDVTDLNNGVYLMTIKGENHLNTVKVIK